MMTGVVNVFHSLPDIRMLLSASIDSVVCVWTYEVNGGVCEYSLSTQFFTPEVICCMCDVSLTEVSHSHSSPTRSASVLMGGVSGKVYRFRPDTRNCKVGLLPICTCFGIQTSP